MSLNNKQISRVQRSKAEAKENYDRMSRLYDWFAGIFEKKYEYRALRMLNIGQGEIVLEIGFGTGHCLKQMAERVGENGKVFGIDISSGMLHVSRKRLQKAGLSDRVDLYCGDALKMQFENNKFDSVFMSFTLELFDTPEIPEILEEIRRILKPGGKFGVVSLSKKKGNQGLIRFYEWVHNKYPRFVDCRPIFVEQSLKENGFEINQTRRVHLFGLPTEIVIGTKGV